MEIKVSTVKAKEAKVNIGLDPRSAEVLKEFLTTAMQDNVVCNITTATLATKESIVSEIICGIINGLDGE